MTLLEKYKIIYDMEILLQSPKPPPGRTEPTLGQKLWHGTKYLASALISPVWLKKVEKKGNRRRRPWSFLSFKFLRISIFLVAYHVVQPLSLFLFPKAEEMLERERLDPKIVANVTSVKDVRVVSDNLASKIYLMTSSYPVGLLEDYSSIFNKKVFGFHSTYSTSPLLDLLAPDVDCIFVKNDRNALEENYLWWAHYADSISGGNFKFIAPITADERYAYVLLHEVRHTSSENQQFPNLYREGDADYQAITQLAAARKDTSLFNRMLKSRLLFSPYDDEHDTPLYLYMKFNKQALPTEQEMHQANKDAECAIELWREIKAEILCLKGSQESFIDLYLKFNKELKKLSPLAHKHVELYQAAWSESIAFDPKFLKAPTGHKK